MISKNIIQTFKKGSQARKVLDIISRRRTPISSKALKERTQASNVPAIVHARINPKLAEYGLAIGAVRTGPKDWAWEVKEKKKGKKA